MQVLKFVRGYGSRAVRGRLWPCGVVVLILAQGSAAPSDPWQGINLPLYAFNDVFDTDKSWLRIWLSELPSVERPSACKAFCKDRMSWLLIAR